MSSKQTKQSTTLIIAAIIVVIFVVVLGALIYRYRCMRPSRSLMSFYENERSDKLFQSIKGKKKKGYQIKDNFSVLESEVRFPDSSKATSWIGKSGLRELQKEQMNNRLKAQYDAYSDAMKIATNFCRASTRERKIRDSLPCIGARNDMKFYYPIIDEKIDKVELRKIKLYSIVCCAHKSVTYRIVLLVHICLNKCPSFNAQLLTSLQKNFENPLGDVNVESLSLGTCRPIDFTDNKQFLAFQFTLQTLKVHFTNKQKKKSKMKAHPYLANMYEVELSRDKEHLFLFQDLEKNGSLRDRIYEQDLSRPYDEKYSRPGKPLDLNTIRRYGRQILEAMRYLSSCGIIHYHLHTGNIIVSSNDGDVYLSNIENNFLGLLPKHPYHKFASVFYKQNSLNIFNKYIYVFHLHGDLVAELCLFGYVLFEMAAGMQSPTPSPLDSLHELPKKLPSPVVNVLGRIFGDKSLGTVRQISDLMDDPLFVAKNAPPLDVEQYLALRKENEQVEYLRAASVAQCLRTYSKEVLDSNSPKRFNDKLPTLAIRKKKKEKK
ncbi:hypothetical protein RFI_08782 [Reticulomyxa filosa]|uniref:Protein kinase domain-containing protein n=1 Tax=Reticulomyxa filosa TaxID=46433 RepID=X6NRK0_RETFI|nr:hypothetical protein RFI_08782 [Reticulomyxa filosa]|eukprot:ETO28349.1 hypothetical protein RFI_08782 [Reticulomyxa filosa]